MAYQPPSLRLLTASIFLMFFSITDSFAYCQKDGGTEFCESPVVSGVWQAGVLTAVLPSSDINPNDPILAVCPNFYTESFWGYGAASSPSEATEIAWTQLNQKWLACAVPGYFEPSPFDHSCDPSFIVDHYGSSDGLKVLPSNLPGAPAFLYRDYVGPIRVSCNATVPISCPANTLFVVGAGNVGECHYPSLSLNPKALGIPRCENAIGNPIDSSTGNKFQIEMDVTSAIQFNRFYSSNVMRSGSIGSYWNGEFDTSITIQFGSVDSFAQVTKNDGKLLQFKLNVDGSLTGDSDISDSLEKILDAGGVQVGWRFIDGLARLMYDYNNDGRLSKITDSNNKSKYLVYSGNLLTSVVDDFNRSLSFTYDSKFRLATITDSAGGVYVYAYDINGDLTKVTKPDNSFRQYTYLPEHKLSSIIDENGDVFATYTYDPVSGKALSTEHAGGVEKYAVLYGVNASQVTDPNLTPVVRNFTTINGVPRLTAQSQEAGSGCSYSEKYITYDTNGGVLSKQDFNGSTTCYARSGSDWTRVLDTAVMEGLPAGTDCGQIFQPDYAQYLPPPSTFRRFNNQWHPDWRLRTAYTEPKKLTTIIYNGQPDPFNANIAASCMPATPTLPSGKVPPVICKTVEQATMDFNGGEAFSAALDASVPSKINTYTYNQFGQVLTATDSLGKVVSNTYYTDTTADHTMGDMQSSTSASGRVTTFDKYDKYGKVIQFTGSNGSVTNATYDYRGNLLSSSAGGLTASFTYDAVGQLMTQTNVDGTSISFVYDAAHRLIKTTDAAGNSVDYTLDNMGNRIGESLKDVVGTQVRSIQRSYDALNRLQSVTGAPR